MTMDTADDLLVDASASSSPAPAPSKQVLDPVQTTADFDAAPSTSALPSADDDDVEMPSIQIPDEAALAAAAAAMAAAAHGADSLDQQQQRSAADAGLDAPDAPDDLNSYLLAAAAASVHAQQQLSSDAAHQDHVADSFEPTAMSAANGLHAHDSSTDAARTALHDQCRKYTDDRAPFPLIIGKRTPGGCAQSDKQSLEHLSQIETTVELGKTRCYWALLSADYSQGNEPSGERLRFVYLDPVLQQHMAEQAAQMVGSDFYDYVHPEERERVSDDMQKIVESRTLFGSVTRCRYSRIPRIRELLGAVDPPRDPEADRYVEDDSFVAIDIVINWIGDGMLLCFFHAIIDKAAEDNDEQHKSDWTNWCGTPQGSFTARQCDTIWKQVKSTPRETIPGSGPDHVFQVIEAGVDSRVLLSWPPPRLFSREVEPNLLAQSDTTVFQDGSYFADDFARLAQGVSIAPGSSSLSDANTSCTRRFRAKHTLTTEGKVRSIESVLIPYGGVILACFHTTFQQQLPPPDPKLVLQAKGALQAQTEPRRKAQDEHANDESPNKRQRMEDDNRSEVPASNDAKAGKPQTTSTVPAPSSTPSLNGLSATSLVSSTPKVPGHPSAPIDGHAAKATNGHTPRPPVSKHARPGVKSEAGGINLYTNAPTKPPSTPTSAPRPAAERTTSAAVPKAANGHSNGISSPSPATAAAAAAGSESPSAASPNKACTGCGKINSPEWRRGPSGHKTLCNACGLRYARSLTRRKKKKGKDGEVEFIEPTGDPTVVPKSRGGGGGSLPGVHRKNSKKRKEEEAAKAAVVATIAATTGAGVAAAESMETPVRAATASTSSASPSSASATQSPAATATPIAKSELPVKAKEGKPAVSASVSSPVKDASSSGASTAATGDTTSTAANGSAGDAKDSIPGPAAAIAADSEPIDPSHSMAVSIALDAIAQASSGPLIDTDTLPLPVSNALSRAIAATLGSTATDPSDAAANESLVTSQSLSTNDADETTDLDPAVSAAALQTIESVVSEALYKQLVNSELPETPPEVKEIEVERERRVGGLSDALTADAIRAAAQAAVAHGVAED